MLIPVQAELRSLCQSIASQLAAAGTSKNCEVTAAQVGDFAWRWQSAVNPADQTVQLIYQGDTPTEWWCEVSLAELNRLANGSQAKVAVTRPGSC